MTGKNDSVKRQDEVSEPPRFEEERSEYTPPRRARKEKIGKPYVRRSFELHPEVDELLTQLQDRFKTRSNTDVLQKAVQLLAYVIHEENKGRRIYIDKGNGNLQELLIL